MNTIIGHKVASQIKNTNWDAFLEAQDEKDFLESFVRKFNDIYDKARKTNFAKPRKSSNSWMNVEIMNMCKERDKLYKRWKRNPNDLVRKTVYS